MSKKEYIEQLYFCAKNNLLCFEYYRRNKDWKRKKAEQMKQEMRCGGIGNVKTNRLNRAEV